LGRSATEKIYIYIYISTIRPGVTYAAETWAVTEGVMSYLMMFERSLRKIFGPIQERDGWTIRTIH
jgi:hypothetical protein